MIRIFVDAAAIRRATEEGAAADRPIRVERDGTVTAANRVRILGPSAVVYVAGAQLPSMARCWVETDAPVIID